MDYICILEFIGGEPFLYSEIDKLLNYAVKQEKIGKVEFTTNAIAKYKDSTLDIIQENKTKVFISISDYGELNAKRADLLKNNLEERGIECRFCGDGNAWWIDAGILEKYHKSNALLQYNLLTCYQSIECVILWDGKLYRCGRAPALAELGVSTDKSNYFNIRELDVESGKGDLIEDFLKAKYAECCQYCKMSNIIKKKIVAGVQLERK